MNSASSGQACITDESPVTMAPLIMHWPYRPMADGHNSLCFLVATSRRSRWRFRPATEAMQGEVKLPKIAKQAEACPWEKGNLGLPVFTDRWLHTFGTNSKW